MFGIGMSELLVILLIVLLFFGANRIPQLMNAFGRGVKSFKNGTEGKDIFGDKIEEEPEKKNKEKDIL